MKYGFLPKVIWFMFCISFKKQLHIVTNDNPRKLMEKAKQIF